MSQVPEWISQLSVSRVPCSSSSTRSLQPLDYQDPFDNLLAFGKLWAGFDAPVVGAFHGTMFASIGTQRLRPLFGYCGFGIFQARLESNGFVRLRGKEVGLFSDLKTGQILEEWDNPFTGERVKVFNFLNDRIRGVLGPEMPRFAFGDQDDAPTLMNEASAIIREDGSTPFILPWEFFGDSALLSWDYTHCYRNPVTADKWPSASTGEFINPSEHFAFSARRADLEDPDCPSAPYHCGFTRLSPWWPWMRMGKRVEQGLLFGRMHSHKTLLGYDEIPKAVRDYTERHYPSFMEPADDWDDGAPIGTWEAYARDVPPENNNA